MMKLQIAPPELCFFDRKRYASDLHYRNECDQEAISERAERIKLLLHSTGMTDV